MVITEPQMATPWDYSKEENYSMPSINPTGALLHPAQVSTWEQSNVRKYELYTTKNESLNHSHGTQSIDT